MTPMLAVYVVLAIGLVVGIRYFRKLRAESNQAQKVPRTLQNYRSNWKREKTSQARENRAGLIAAAVQRLS
ncbi:MAG: hypothetical protein ABSD48_14225, partial [Armatimonadota bacterium]